MRVEGWSMKEEFREGLKTLQGELLVRLLAFLTAHQATLLYKTERHEAIVGLTGTHFFAFPGPGMVTLIMRKHNQNLFPADWGAWEWDIFAKDLDQIKSVLAEWEQDQEREIRREFEELCKADGRLKAQGF